MFGTVEGRIAETVWAGVSGAMGLTVGSVLAQERARRRGATGAGTLRADDCGAVREWRGTARTLELMMYLHLSAQ